MLQPPSAVNVYGNTISTNYMAAAMEESLSASQQEGAAKFDKRKSKIQQRLRRYILVNIQNVE